MNSSHLGTFLFALIFPLVLGGFGILAARGSEVPGELRYTRALCIAFAALGVVPAIGVAALAVASPPEKGDDWIAFTSMLVGFPLLAFPLVLEAARVRHAYDDDRIVFRSPWSRTRTLRWAEVDVVRWRSMLKWLDLRAADGTVVHLSPMLHGLTGFAEKALAKVPHAVLDRASPDAQAVLVLLRDGRARDLIVAQARPATLAGTSP